MQVLDVTQKQETSYCVPLWLRDEQIRLNVKRVKGRLEPHDPQDLRKDPIAIVGYGPSLNDTWKQIKKFKYIITCSGAHKFLLERGIVPSWHSDVDPREHKAKLLGPPHKDVEYLIASTCHPKMFDQLEGYNVKLWHIFAQDGESEQVLPRGEWSLTGGCDAGMRCITIARFLGFTDCHLFGIDGSEGKSGKHAAAHPNQPPQKQPVEYGGKTYQTTPALLACAQQIFHEFDQLPDVKFKFYGDGLIQAMAKDYKRKPTMGSSLIAFNKPELISPEMREQNAQLHRSNAAYGAGGAKHAPTVLKLVEDIKTQIGRFPSVLDFGAGKQQLAKALPWAIWSYDPAIPEISEMPRPADIVICSDVLEHVEPDKLKIVLSELRRCVLKVGYFVIHKGPAKKTYPNGANAHLIQQDSKWWEAQLSKFFSIGKIIDNGVELHVVVGPKAAAPQPEVAVVEQGLTRAKFYTPNKTTKWRASTLLTKEPSTIEWINSFQPGEVFFDVGANVGGYSIWAGKKGARVFAFEPEAENYALLIKNMNLNGLEANAYPIALSDHDKLSRLYLSGNDLGGSCHSFGDAVGPDLLPRETRFQGAVGMPLDELVERGLPHPNYIKIDVDGLEFRVIKGAEKVLSNGSVKGLLVEVNTNLPEHQEMVRYIGELGYEYDPAQVERAKRKEGPFKGVAEYVFRRVNEIEKHLVARLDDVEIKPEPFPHLFLEDFLDGEQFEQLLKHMPKPKKWVSISKVRGTGYPKRFVADPQDDIWRQITTALRGGAFKRALCGKFGVDPAGLTDETLLIRDHPGYKIGPHTDEPRKVISALLYLQGEEGTSLYVPREKGFACPGGPHYPFNKFKRIATMPFKPNSLFAFLKADNSFHGVEPVKTRRDVLLYDVRKLNGE